MGIVNVTPDSFSDGGVYAAPDDAVAHGLSLAAAGADLIDVGGESTRPGAAPVAIDDERRRVLGVIEALSAQVAVPLSVDTTRPEVAAEAVAAGAGVINDVSMLRDGPALAAVAAQTGAGLILMHSRGTPATMQDEADYDGDPVTIVRRELDGAVRVAARAGVQPDRLLIDPGIGFAKTAATSLMILSRLEEFTGGRWPVVVGVSRKSFIGEVLDLPVADRLEGTLAAETAAAMAGAAMVRTHDVVASRRAVQVADALRRQPPRTGRTVGRLAS